MQDITKIETKNWQHKRNTIGEVVKNIYDIKQCIETIITTVKGTVPFMPELGCEQIEAIGENPQDAIDILRTIWLKEIAKQEPRCEVIDITGTYDDNGQIDMKIYFKEKTTGTISYIDKYLFYATAI